VAQGTAHPGLCLCSPSPTSVINRLLSQASRSGCLPCLFSSLWVQLFCICKVEWVACSFCTLCSFRGFSLVCVLKCRLCFTKGTWLSLNGIIHLNTWFGFYTRKSDEREADIFFSSSRESHDVFSGKSLLEDLKMYKQGDISSAFLCQTVKIFPGHPGLWFSLVVPSFG